MKNVYLILNSHNTTVKIFRYKKAAETWCINHNAKYELAGSPNVWSLTCIKEPIDERRRLCPLK